MLLNRSEKSLRTRAHFPPLCSASGRIAEFGKFLHALVNAHPCLVRMMPRPVPVSSPRAVVVRDFRG